MVVTAVLLLGRLRAATAWHRRVLGPLYAYGIVAVLFAPVIHNVPGLVSDPLQSRPPRN